MVSSKEPGLSLNSKERLGFIWEKQSNFFSPLTPIKWEDPKVLQGQIVKSAQPHALFPDPAPQPLTLRLGLEPSFV